MRAAPKAVQDSPSSRTAKFTAAYRLRRKPGFDHILRANTLSVEGFRVFFKQNGKKNARLGVAVSKKTAPRAADRNRMKRVIREVFRCHNVKLCGVDLVVMLKREGAGCKRDQTGNLKVLLDRVKNRCTSS